MEKFEKLRQAVSAIETDARKFYDMQNSAAGTRLRKAMLEIRTLAKNIRMEVTEIKNSEQR
ncbi:histone H1 [Pedobacter sp. SYP-B3415]|uniref:histone H1 n=1 Tax=Pedobacter sp. SYP-B3415 TaxID=2496641 RepID=UPI00101CBBD7|nr:histone H1 [Pedobacter sp. SYP-B3415]